MKQTFLVTVDFEPDYTKDNPYEAPLSDVIGAVREQQSTLGIPSHAITNQSIQSVESATEINPGKPQHSSASGQYYFSCDNFRGGVLVGQKDFRAATPEEMNAGRSADGSQPLSFGRVPVSTCPILGISRLVDFPNYTAKDFLEWPEWLTEGTNKLSDFLLSPVRKNQFDRRPSIGYLDEGTGIGFVTRKEWAECFPHLAVMTQNNDNNNDNENEDTTPTEPTWMCILCTEVGIFELHTDME